MRQNGNAKKFLFIGIMALAILLSTACEPPLPTVEMQTQPTDTNIPPANTAIPQATPISRPAEESSKSETPVPTLSHESVLNITPAAQKVVAAARTDLIQRLGVAEGDIITRSVEEVEWPNASLGCPQPGKMYAQVITPGFRIVLTVDEKDYTYHTDMRRAILCEQESVMPAPSGPPGVEQGEFPIADFDPDLVLFVEVQEERLSQPGGGQTTSFKGDMIFYDYDAERGTLTGKMDFPIDKELRIIVGKTLTTQIGDNRASSSLLYPYPGEPSPGLYILFTGLNGEGRLCFTHGDTEYCLNPGESIDLEQSAESGQEKSMTIAQKASLTITNHGFIDKENLIATP